MRWERVFWVLVACSLASSAAAGQARERAIEQIPELMGRILETQQEIRDRESEYAPRIEQHAETMVESRRAVEAASSEQEAAESLVRYIEAYAARLDEQHEGLVGIQSSVVRMRADARELARVARATRNGDPDAPAPQAERRAFYQDHFQGLASATGELADRLGRQSEASTAGAVLHASWASHEAIAMPMRQLGPEGALAFARQVEGLYARVQARSNQLRAERRSVRRLLDLLIERQLARSLDGLFDGTGELSLGALVAGGSGSGGAAGSGGWDDLDSLVSRTLGLPTGETDLGASRVSLDRLDFFARGDHREWEDAR
ncbi:MAG: hypothetical protein QNK03_19155 [Myxococcota bacterium]|nr:hypothetical protein [Myxococcota bacterium]